jgi:hypothetical protein
LDDLLLVRYQHCSHVVEGNLAIGANWCATDNLAAKSIRPPSQSGRQVNLAGNKASIWHVAKS